MNLRPLHLRSLCLTLALLALPWVAWQQRGLNEQRRSLGLTQQPVLESAPPVIAFTTVALGSFRGLLANALWLRAVRLQDAGDYFELVTLGDWITKLQPDFAMVWAHQAWNMTYNVSRTFERHEDRWLWVRSGMELLRDEGLRYNPHDPLLHRELAWIFQDKIGKYTDLAHVYYKQQWIAEMHSVLGANPSLESFVNPQTDDTRQRAAILRERYKLEPALMRELDEKYGPLDWRMPESHAIYWAALGLNRCRGNAFDMLSLRRAIWQSMQGSFLRGRLIEHPDQRADFGPNLGIIPKVNQAYEEMKAAEPEKRDYISRGQTNFIQSAIYHLYTHNRLNEASSWFQYARTNFPGFAAEDLHLDEFVVAGVTRTIELGNPSQTRALLEGLIARHLQSRFYGEDDDANGHALLARRVWEYYQQRNRRAPNLQMPPLSEIQAEVEARLFPELQLKKPPSDAL